MSKKTKKELLVSIPDEYLQPPNPKEEFLRVFSDLCIDHNFNYEKAIQSLGVTDKKRINSLMMKLPFDPDVRDAISMRLISRGLSGFKYYRDVVIDKLHTISNISLSDYYDQDGNIVPPQKWSRRLGGGVKKIKFKETVMPQGEGDPISILEHEVELFDPIKAGEYLIKYSSYLDEPAQKKLDNKFNAYINDILNGDINKANLSNWLEFMLKNFTNIFYSKENMEMFVPALDKIGNIVKSKEYVKTNMISLDKLSTFFTYLQDVVVDLFGDDPERLEQAQKKISDVALRVFDGNAIESSEDMR